MIIDKSTGKVYIQNWNSNPTSYTSPQFGASIGLVEISKLPMIFAERARLCCGVIRQKYSFANANTVTVWHTGHLGALPDTCEERQDV